MRAPERLNLIFQYFLKQQIEIITYFSHEWLWIFCKILVEKFFIFFTIGVCKHETIWNKHNWSNMEPENRFACFEWEKWPYTWNKINYEIHFFDSTSTSSSLTNAYLFSLSRHIFFPVILMTVSKCEENSSKDLFSKRKNNCG